MTNSPDPGRLDIDPTKVGNPEPNFDFAQDLIPGPGHTPITGPQFPSSPPQTVVIMDQTRRQTPRTNSCGMASFVLGILSVIFFWFPGINLLFCTLGFLMGCWGLFVAMDRRGAGVGFALSGTVLSAATGVVILWVAPIFTGFLDRFRPTPSEPPTIAESSVDFDWSEAENGSRLKDVQIIARARRGHVNWESSGEIHRSPEERLTIWLSIKNRSRTRKIDYKSWRRVGAELEDEHGNRYAIIIAHWEVSIDGASGPAALHPHQTLTDAMVFELPIRNAKELRLTLPGTPLGLEGNFHCRIKNP